MNTGRPGPAVAGGSLAMIFVGSSAAASAALAAGPLLSAQAVRYAAACLLLLAAARLTGRSVRRPRGRQWVLLAAVAAAGLVLFNVALVHGSQHAEPAVLGVAVAGVPLVLALVGPVLEGRAPRGRVLVAALVVTCGAVLVVGFGRTDAVGLLWAAVVFVCEAGFTLFAVPLLVSLGPYSVSVHTTWLAAVGFGVLGLLAEGPAATGRLDAPAWAAVAFLAVAVTAVAFVLWYGCVATVGAARAALLTGIAPVAAAAAGVALGGPVPGPAVWVGVCVVGAGLAFGFTGGAGRDHPVVEVAQVGPTR